MKVTKYEAKNLIVRTKMELVEMILDLKKRCDSMTERLSQMDYQTRTKYSQWVDVQGELRCENCKVKAPILKDKLGIHGQIKPEYCFKCGSRMSNGEKF